MSPTEPPPRRTASPTGRRARAALLGLLAIVCVVGTTGGRLRKPYGLSETGPMGPFLNGIFPSARPQGSVDWSVTEAFPNLVGVPNGLVLVPNPADGRLCAGSRDGLIVSFENDPAVTGSTPFMDLRDRAAEVAECGFLGLVFHPEFGQPGSPYELTFYAFYTTYCPTNLAGDDIDWSSCNPGYPRSEVRGFFNTWLRLSRFQAYFDAAEGVYKGDPASESPMLNIRHYNSVHCGGGLVIDDDHNLVLSIGDQLRYTTAQDITNELEGGVLRLAIDIVENPNGTWSCPVGSHLRRRNMRSVTGNPDEMSGRLYCIPDDNPWLDPLGGVFEEYYSLGHRNPHRLTRDRATGRLWSGEVGEYARDEINVILKGRNYGWPFREGKIAGPFPPPTSIIGTLTDPVIDFDRSEAQAVIGGYVYRGTQLPELAGRFIAGDWATRNIWAIDLDPTTMTATKELLTTFDPGGLATFGEGLAGELILGSVFPGVPLQRLERIVQGVTDPPPFLSQLGAFDDLATLDVHDGAVPFEVLPFWSDGATKRRWLFLPSDGVRDEPGERIGFSATGNWSFPVGTVFMKHFDLPLDERAPSVTTRLETRFLVHGTDGWYGVTYRWNAAQTDARLLATSETANYTIQTSGGGTRPQTWTFPSRSDCLTCHNAGVGGPAGPRTHQLNRDFFYPSREVTDNQLRAWNHARLFDPALVESNIPNYLAAASLEDPGASLELRGRSYLDTNCSYCHRPGPGNPASFDTRLTTPLAQQGLVWGPVANAFGVPDPYLIKPRVPSSSLIYHRAASLGGVGMPPLAKSLVDQKGVALLSEWIERIEPTYPQITNQPPTLTAPPYRLNSVGDAISLALSASDPDGDSLYFSAQGLPPGVAIDAETGTIQGTLGPASGGTHITLVGVSDGPTAAAASFLWSVHDGTPPSIALAAPAPGAILSGVATLRATVSSDVVGVQFLLDGAELSGEDTAPPYELAWNTAAVADGPHALSARARDGGGNTATAAAVNVTLDNSNLQLVAAWSFDEGAGPVAHDATGNGNDGAINGAAWTAQGRHGGALEFAEVDDAVLVQDDDALDLGNAMTVSAWVYPTSTASYWAPVVQKQVDAYFLDASSPGARAVAGVTANGVCCPSAFAPGAPSAGTWTHLAMTYNGAQVTIYVNGAAAASAPAPGPLQATTGPLWIGNNSYADEIFRGRIDDVRLYDRVLTPAEIVSDMNAGVSGP